MTGAHIRQEIVATAKQMVVLGLNQGTSGNVSVRAGNGFLVTPSGVTPEDLGPADVVEMAMDGTPEGGNPSSEWRFHRDILVAHKDVGAIVHAHSPAATALSCLRREIPAFHYMVAAAGGRNIRCADYATFGTQALSDHVLQALRGHRACLMANHGMIATGPSLKKALMLAVEVEALSGQYLATLQAGKPTLLDDEEMDRVIERFKSYGPGSSGSSGASGASGASGN